MRMYQSYLLLRKEQNELLIQNRRKEERNRKLKYELESLRGNSYYSNLFFNNDSDNLFEDLASGISNIWKWMDMESKSAHMKSGHMKSGHMKSGHMKSGHMKSGQKDEAGPTALVDHSEGESRSRLVKRGCVKYGQVNNRFADQERSSTRVDKEPGTFTSMECPKDNIIDYLKGRLSNGGSILGRKAALSSSQKAVMGVHTNWIRPNVDPNKRIIKDEEKFLFHICNCKENKYVPLNVGSFFMVPPKRTLPDEDFSLASMQKCMEFILRRKERGSHSEMRVRHKKGSNVPCDGVPLENATPKVSTLSEQKGCAPRKDEAGVDGRDGKGPPPVGQSNSEEGKKKTHVIKEVELKRGVKTGGLEKGEGKQILKKGESGRKRFLKEDRNGSPSKGGTVQNCQLKGKKYNTHKMDMGPGSKFGRLMSRKGLTQRRDSLGKLNFKVVPKKEEQGGEIFSLVVKVKTARLVPHAKGHPRYVRLARVCRRFLPSRGSRCARNGLEDIPKGGKNRNGGNSKRSELPCSFVANPCADGK
ncbi:hypothetical protein PCYB_021750, partial [Plasmodium cynomolgi strain B]